MRLIDADALLTNMDKGMQGTAREYLKFYQMAVNDEPTAYDVDKVVEQLKKMRSKREEQLRICADNDMADYLRCKMSAIAEAIEIVKSGGIE